MLQDVLSDLEHEIKQVGATIEISDLPTIDANPSQMYRLFQNLLANAVKYRSPDRSPMVQVFASPASDSPQIFQLREDGRSFREIAREVGLSWTGIQQIVNENK